MNRRQRAALLAPILVLMLSTTACLDELAEVFQIIAYSESDDPDVRRTGESLAEIREEREAREALDRFIETGERRHLDDALAIRPDDTELHGYNVAAAIQGGDAGEIEAAKAALTVAEGRRLSGLTDPGDPPITSRHLHRNVLGEILVAQTTMLGGSLNRPWDPPSAEAPPAQQQLFADYCATRHEIQTDFNDDLSYIPLPPCPGD